MNDKLELVNNIPLELQKAESTYFFQQLDFPGNESKAVNFFKYQVEGRPQTYLLPFNKSENSAFSVNGLPFGGINCIGGAPLYGDVIKIYSKWIEGLGGQKINFFEVTLPPESYSPIFISLQVKALLELKFEVSGDSISFHLLSTKNFEKNLHPSLRRKLQGFQKSGNLVKMYGPERLQEYMEFALRIRSEKGIPISIDFELLAQQFERYPENYDLFLIENNRNIIGGGIGIFISSEVYYKFYPVTDPNYNHLSPMVALSFEMFKRAKILKCKIFDLGIAGPLGGPENLGLATFKSRLGGIPSIKFRFQKTI